MEERRRQNGKRKMSNEPKEEFKGRRDECLVTQKKATIVWTPKLHGIFLDAINEIGLEKATPMKIFKVMKDPGLSGESVGSHLQKYRLYLEKVEKYVADPRNSRWFINEIHNRGLNPQSLYNNPQSFPQFVEQHQIPFTPFRLGLEGNVRGFKAPRNMPPVCPPQVSNKKTLRDNFMDQASYGQFPMSNQGNSQQPWLGDASFVNQQNFSGHVTSKIIGEGNIGSLDSCNQVPNFYANNYIMDNNYGKVQMTNPAVVTGVNQARPFGGMLSNVNSKVNQMDEIHKGKRPMEAVKASHGALNFNGLNTNYATQGESSSCAFGNPNQFQAMPPQGHQQHNEESDDNLINLLFNQGNQSTNQQQCAGIVDPDFYINEYLLNSPKAIKIKPW